MSEQNNRASFGGKLSVILVAAGSAIGLGAIWRFPYMAGENGGAAFLIVFLLSVFVVGIPAMLAEFAVGRRTRKNAVGAFRSLSKKWSWLGYSGVLGALLISGYYYLIAGWSLEYLFSSLTGTLYSSDVPFTQHFASFQESWRPLIYGVLFILMTHFIVSRGVEKGIEKASKIMMPLLFVILVIMAVRVAFMPNAIEGYRFFLSCDFKEAFKTETIMMAIGQAFFSLSVGMGCMVTYASYFKSNNNLVTTSFNVSLLTLLVSVLAGLVIFPAVFSAGLQPTEGASLVFVTLPEIFKGMPLASLWSAIFFLLVMLASLTSTISFHEVLTAYVAEELKDTSVVMTKFDIRYSDLPAAVRTAFETEYGTQAPVDDVERLERNDNDTIYFIETEVVINGFLTDIDLDYAEDGTLLRTTVDVENYDNIYYYI